MKSWIDLVTLNEYETATLKNSYEMFKFMAIEKGLSNEQSNHSAIVETAKYLSLPDSRVSPLDVAKKLSLESSFLLKVL